MSESVFKVVGVWDPGFFVLESDSVYRQKSDINGVRLRLIICKPTYRNQSKCPGPLKQTKIFMIHRIRKSYFPKNIWTSEPYDRDRGSWGRTIARIHWTCNRNPFEHVSLTCPIAIWRYQRRKPKKWSIIGVIEILRLSNFKHITPFSIRFIQSNSPFTMSGNSRSESLHFLMPVTRHLGDPVIWCPFCGPSAIYTLVLQLF